MCGVICPPVAVNKCAWNTLQDFHTLMLPPLGVLWDGIVLWRKPSSVQMAEAPHRSCNQTMYWFVKPNDCEDVIFYSRNNLGTWIEIFIWSHLNVSAIKPCGLIFLDSNWKTNHSFGQIRFGRSFLFSVKFVWWIWQMWRQMNVYLCTNHLVQRTC